jgi:hypothetical protein
MSVGRALFRTKVLAGGSILLGIAVSVAILLSRSSARLKLPVGPGVPAISLGERHGLILASDGSLWYWGVVLGDPPTMKSRFVDLAARFASLLRMKAVPVNPPPVVREKPSLLQNE